MRQTSMRLPQDLYDALRKRVEESGESAEEIMRRLLWKELREPKPATDASYLAASLYEEVRAAMERFNARCSPAFGLHPLPQMFEFSRDEAYRFLQALPITCQAVIKEITRKNEALIIWANESMERACDRSLSEMLGRPVEKLDVLSSGADGEKVLNDIKMMIADKGKKGFESLETVRWPGMGKALLRVQRFKFAVPGVKDRLFLGDLSFDFAAIERDDWKPAPERAFSTAPTFAGDPLEGREAPSGLFEAFLEGASVAGVGCAIKEAYGAHRYLWVNEAFAKRAGADRERIVGTSVENNRERPAEYRRFIAESDARVAEEKIWMFTRHWLSGNDKPPLAGLRFPIYGPYKNVERIGVLNAEFHLEMPKPDSRRSALTPIPSTSAKSGVEAARRR